MKVLTKSQRTSFFREVAHNHLVSSVRFAFLMGVVFTIAAEGAGYTLYKALLTALQRMHF